MSKIVMPEGMLNAVVLAIGGSSDSWSRRCCTTAAEAVLRRLSEHPVVPTDEQVGDMLRDLRRAVTGWNDCSHYYQYRDLMVEWQRRMFFAPEPSPVVAEVKTRLLGCTLTAGDAAELMNVIQRCTKPEHL